MQDEWHIYVYLLKEKKKKMDVLNHEHKYVRKLIKKRTLLTKNLINEDLLKFGTNKGRG